ncbi:MAG: VWA domain-containing protein [Deltaproteobacteria bacterium]|nr:VWA domain-containing protein [Deltaproteobacteria bacterium]
MLGVAVNAKITGLVAEVTVEQSFKNAFSEPLEATYIFPLPDRAATNRLVMTVAGREIVGILKERGEAREEFDRAIATGHRAAIAEEERPGVFTMRVGNLMPKEVAKVTLTMTVPLVFEDGEGTLRFPLVVAPRYIPGAALSGAQAGDGVAEDTDAVPDASRISPPVLLPGMPNAVRLAIGVDIDPAGLPLAGVRSSLHAIVASGTYGDRITGPLRIEIRPGERLDRDFILRLAFMNDTLVTAAVAAPLKNEQGQATKQGVFRVTFMPPASLMRVVKPKDVIFVLDQSGSMGGWKMVAARRAVARMVDTLTSQDRFNVYAFDDQITPPKGWREDELKPATDRNRFHAVEFLATVEARGGTEMAAPLNTGCDALLAQNAGERERVIVLVTDGQVGNEDQIVAALAKPLQHIRVFTVGIDRAVNEGFLRRLATLGAGAMELVEGEARLDEAMDRIHRKLGTPLLTDVSIRGEGIDIEPDTVTPDRIAAVFAGSPLEVAGRYTEHAPLERSAIVISAKDGTGRRFTQSLAPQRTENLAVGRMWARSRVRALEDRYASGNGDQARLEQELVQTSLAFSVLCRFTAFVAVDKAEIVNRGGKQHRVTQAVDPASGWGMLGTDDAADGSAPQADAPEMQMSMDMDEEAASMEAAPEPELKQRAKADRAERISKSIAAGAPMPPRAKSPAPAPMQAQAMSPSRPSAGSAIGSAVGGAIGAAAGAVAKLAQKAKPSKKGKKEAAREAPKNGPVDLGAYARRADELLQTARTLDTLDSNAVTLFMIRVRSLVDDLQSLSAGDDQIAELVRCFLRFEDAYAKADVSASGVKTALEALREALLVFGATSGEAAHPAGAARQSFWKKPRV